MFKKLIMFFGTMLAVKVATAQVTFNQAQEVFNQMYNTSGQHSKLFYSPDLASNAYNTDGGYSVVITQGMLNDLQNKDQLAMVLGHELGHAKLEHYRPKFHPRQEMDADDIGYYYCKKAGYKRCIGALKVLQKKYGDGSNDGVHPNWSTRIKEVIRRGK